MSDTPYESDTCEASAEDGPSRRLTVTLRSAGEEGLTDLIAKAKNDVPTNILKWKFPPNTGSHIVSAEGTEEFPALAHNEDCKVSQISELR